MNKLEKEKLGWMTNLPQPKPVDLKVCFFFFFFVGTKQQNSGPILNNYVVLQYGTIHKSGIQKTPKLACKGKKEKKLKCKTVVHFN